MRELIEIYLQFSTEISVDSIKYRDLENKIPINLSPAVTFCFNYLYDKVLYEENNRKQLAILNNKYISGSSKLEVMKNVKTDINLVRAVILQQFNHAHILGEDKKEAFYGILNSILNKNNEEEYEKILNELHNKNISGFDPTFTEFKFFASTILCHDIFKVRKGNCEFTKSLMPFGQCLTHFKEKESDLASSDHFSSNLFSNQIDKYHYNSHLKYLELKLLFHPSNTFPDIKSEEVYLTDTGYLYTDSQVLKLSRYEFERLPKTYETNCHNYGNSNRFQCLNDCYFNAYMNQIQCIPNYNSLLTIDLSNYSHYSHYIFCQNDDKPIIDDINKYFSRICDKECKDSCRETIFLTNRLGGNDKEEEEAEIHIPFEAYSNEISNIKIPKN